MATTGFLEQRDAVAGFFAQQSEHCQSAPRYFSLHQYTMPIAWTQVTLADFSLGQAMSRSTV
jgi:hypothetical protein